MEGGGGRGGGGGGGRQVVEVEGGGGVEGEVEVEVEGGGGGGRLSGFPFCSHLLWQPLAATGCHCPVYLGASSFLQATTRARCLVCFDTGPENPRRDEQTASTRVVINKMRRTQNEKTSRGYL